MNSWLVWPIALAMYAAFLAWYVNWRGALTAAEVERYMAQLQASATAGSGRTSLDALRGFLAADDGREFFMLNLIRLAPEPVPDPVTGTPRPAREVMEGYTKMFMPALFARGGHPAVLARKMGPYVDTWGVAPGPEWTAVGYMRYRSRRDLIQLVVDPRFAGAHDFKFAAMPDTFSFPTQPLLLALVSPRIWVGLLLALLAALAQILLLLQSIGG